MPKLIREKEQLKKIAEIYKNYPKSKPRTTRNSNKQNIPKENIIYLCTATLIHEYQIYEEIKREIIREIKENNKYRRNE